MKHSKFISVVIATLLLFCSADAFAQRSRGGKGSGGRSSGGARSVSKASNSSKSSSSSCCVTPQHVYLHYNENLYNYHQGLFDKSTRALDANCGVGSLTKSAPSLFDVFSNDDVLTGYFPLYGYEVSKRTATKESLFIPRSSGDFYYRDGVFFSKSNKSDRKYVIDKPCSGIRVPDIPALRSEYKVDDITYYYYYGTFYIYDASTSEYVVVTPPVGLVVNSMPAYAMKIVINDNSYYVVDNVVYKAVLIEGKCRYVVTTLENEEMHQIKERMAFVKRHL